MTKKDLLKKLESFPDNAEIELIDIEGNGWKISRFSKSGIDPVLVIDREDEYENYDDEEDYEEEDDEDDTEDEY
jgi:hypothetical protein